MLSSQGEVERLLAAIRTAAPQADVARLTDQLSLLCRAQFAPASDTGWTDARLTRLESRLMRALTSAKRQFSITSSTRTLAARSRNSAAA